MRRKALSLISVLLFSLVAMATDASGTWTGTFHTREGGAFETVLVLKVDGNNATGTWQQGNNDEIQIENGKVSGDTATWTITRGTGEKQRKINYTAKISGNSMHVTSQVEGATRSQELDLTKK